MACCKVDDYDGWCEGLSTMTSMKDGKSYCVFHRPKDKDPSNKSVEEFNTKVFEHIQKAIDSNTACNLSGINFPGLISFEQFGEDNPLPSINFSDATFSGDAHFRRTTFIGNANFTNSVFGRIADFFGSTFKSSAHFPHVTFKRQAYFIESYFYGVAEFASSTFSHSVHFRKSDFCGRADFDSCTFSGPIYFMRLTFSEEVSFHRSTFSDKVNFMNVTFSGLASFEDCTFSNLVFFNHATFNGPANFWETFFNGSAYLRSTIFNDSAHFSESTYRGDFLFDKTVFEKETQFIGLKIDGATLRFREVDFTNTPLTFLETELNGIRFDRCQWPQRQGLLGFETSDVLPDEIQVETVYRSASLRDKIFSYAEFSKTYGMIGDLYRQLKQQYKERHNETEASKWHYREKEMFRKQRLLRRFLPSTTTLYCVFSGYGESPIQAGVFLFVLLTALTILMNALGIDAVTGKEVYGVTSIQGFSLMFDWTKCKILIETIVQHALFTKAPYYTASTSGGATILLVFTRLVIPIQAALFAFALRNKFRR